MNAEGKSPKTIQNYKRSIKHFTSAFKKHPKIITQEEIKNYLFELSKEKKFVPATHNLHVSGIKYFYNQVLGISEKNSAFIKKKTPLQLFEILSQTELNRIFQAQKNIRDRLLIKAGYAFGLRVGRAVTLRLSDFDLKRNLLFIKAAKGKKDRFVMLSEDFLKELDYYVGVYGIKDWLFPGNGPDGCITAMHANHILHTAARRAGITKTISYHTLRRSYATHLHEAGHSLRDIQVLMGHSTSRTTERYTKVSNKHIAKIPNPLDSLSKAIEEWRQFEYTEEELNQKHFFNQKTVNKTPQPVSDKITSILPYS